MYYLIVTSDKKHVLPGVFLDLSISYLKMELSQGFLSAHYVHYVYQQTFCNLDNFGNLVSYRCFYLPSPMLTISHYYVPVSSSSSCIISVDVDCYVHRTSSRHLSSSPSLSAPMVIFQQSC